MVQAWYMDDKDDDQRLEHFKTPLEFLSMEDLFKISGVEYFEIVDLQNYQFDQTLQKIKRDRGFTYEDEITCSRECLPNYEEKLKTFFEEHLHVEDEIRLILEGSGYFDVRDKNDRWIRIKMQPGDFIILPSGIYHRFTLDTNDFIKAKRYYIGQPVWTPFNRPAEDMDCRKQYLEKLKNNFES